MHADEYGDANDVAIVTDLLDANAYPAEDLLTHYLSRWGIEQIFQKVTKICSWMFIGN